MKLGIILFIIGVITAIYLANVKLNKKLLKQAGIIFAILLSIYGLIQLLQPDDYIKFTKTTISQESKL